MKLRRPNHATVAAYLALFVALATGGAYAAERIDSGDIRNNSIKSKDLKNRKAVKGKDVKRDSLGGGKIRESSLDLGPMGAIAGVEAVDCNPSSQAPVDCAVAGIQLPRSARILAIGTGGAYSISDTASALCEVRVDDVEQNLESTPATSNTSSTATNGFARTGVSPELPPGSHKVALVCGELGGDVGIESPTIAAIAIG